jgi:phytoene desaturase
MNRSVHIIGAGFSSLAAACYLAQAGYQVTIFEKNDTVGGRARQLKRDGFTFDIGPTWYWMPDVFEKFFADFNKKPSDYYQLEKLSPAYKVYFGPENSITIGDNLSDILQTFERIEIGSGKNLQKFLDRAEKNYNIAIKKLVYRPGVSPLELVTPETMVNVGQFFGSISSRIRKLFRDQRLIQILEFPVLFLGAKPSNTPAFYSFMNHADFGLGTWHAAGGMYKVIEGMTALAKELGVTIYTGMPIDSIAVENKTVTGISAAGKFFPAHIVLSGADYHHTEQLLPAQNVTYSQKYWSKKIFAPSALLFYVGFDKPLQNVEHHTLFFDTDFEIHAQEIYDNPKWPKNPLFYASFPSKTDKSVAPEGKEAAIFLIPLAPGLSDNNETREKYFDIIMERLEKLTNQSIRNNIMFKDSFGVNDFISDYNSFKGNAYGLANTLLQTAFLRPKLKSKKVKNLYFTGQLTVPGPGVPPSLISGQLVAELISKNDRP